jgi:hypothetical protein
MLRHNEWMLFSSILARQPYLDRDGDFMKKFMRRETRIAGIMFAVCIVSCLVSLDPAVAETRTADVVRAADKFLATLAPEQQQKVLFRFDDKAQRARWSNFPTGFVPRSGISLKQMSVLQREAALNLLAVVLSPMGLEKVNEIREADDDFKVNGSRRGPRGGSGRPPTGPSPGAREGTSSRGGQEGSGGPPAFSSDDMFGSNLYYISFLGKPSNTSPWMLQFGGHHLALNITIAGEQGVLTPSLTGAQPATFKLNGKTIRPVGRESDKALTLLQSLDANQRKLAVLPYSVPDLVLGPGQDGKTIVPEGLKASAMGPKQQAMLLDLIDEWAGIINQSSADRRMAEVKAELNETWFAWSGPASADPNGNITAYFRIQGPHLVIEYAPQSDEPNNHVHTIYRDPTDDYGSALVKQ